MVGWSSLLESHYFLRCDICGESKEKLVKLPDQSRLVMVCADCLMRPHRKSEKEQAETRKRKQPKPPR